MRRSPLRRPRGATARVHRRAGAPARSARVLPPDRHRRQPGGDRALLPRRVQARLPSLGPAAVPARGRGSARVSHGTGRRVGRGREHRQRAGRLAGARCGRHLREAWEGGCVMTGASAGMNCWFEASVTDSFSMNRLAALNDGLGWLAGSACPHYDGEEMRQPVYRELVADGFPPGVAADDGVGLLYDGTELVEAVSWRDDGRAFRVARAGEEPIPVRTL